MAIVELMPPQYKHMLGGPSLKVDPHTGAVAEGVLTFTITFAVLWILLKGPRNPILKTWMLAVSTVALVIAGASYTGPSMNPANVSRFFFPNLLIPHCIVIIISIIVVIITIITILNWSVKLHTYYDAILPHINATHGRLKR